MCVCVCVYIGYFKNLNLLRLFPYLKIAIVVRLKKIESIEIVSLSKNCYCSEIKKKKTYQNLDQTAKAVQVSNPNTT